jgi:NitT/TauT family transport system substrate-binding protein
MLLQFSRSRAIATIGALTTAAVCPAVVRAQAATLRVGAISSDAFAIAYYGLEMGFFGRAGIDVQVLPFTNTASQGAAAAGGSLDIGVGDATDLANGVIRGIPFEMIAGGALYLSSAPTTLLVAARSSTIRTARDLEGQTIAVPTLVGLIVTSVRAWLTQNGTDPAKVRFVEMPFPLMADAVARGAVAAAHLAEPALTAGGSEIVPIAQAFDAIGKQFLLSEWFSTREWIVANPDVAKRFITAAYETARWANANREQSLVILAKYAKYDIDRVRAMRRATFATALDLRLVQPVLDAGTRYGALARPFNASELTVRA